MTTSTASAINPEAGSHPVSSDPPEVAVVRRAGERSLEEFPYYQTRYGERGERFAHSDGAWLVAVSAGEWPYVRRQVLWLGGLLAARGIPRWLLERHLRVLHEELAGALPQRARRYEGLLRAADHLRKLRREQLPDAVFDRLAAEFDERVGPEWAGRLPRMGGVLVAAVADERAGIAAAARSVEEWATDRTRFPDLWCDAVAATLARARGHV